MVYNAAKDRACRHGVPGEEHSSIDEVDFMIELGFGESSAGGLKLAKAMKYGDQVSTAARIAGGTLKENGEAQKPHVWSGTEMEGSPMDVVALTLALDIGDISDLDTGINVRKKILDELFADFPDVSEQIIQTSQQALSRLQNVKATLEPVRMWVCAGNPEELCGLYYVCHLLKDTQAPLSVVRVPEQVENENGIISYRHIGEINPEVLGSYVVYEEPISELRRSVYANIWRGLVNENAPLRAVINGNLMGVPEEFYDFVLRANMPDGEFMVAQLVGKALGQIPSVGDRWLFLRIQEMLRSGELMMIADPAEDHPYSGVIKRTNREF